MNKLKACVEELQYDYVFCVEKSFYDRKIISEVQKCNVQKDKVLNFGGLQTKDNFRKEQVLRYYQEHHQEFEMFATEISSGVYGLDARQFKRKMFNFAKTNQDLYYNFETAKFAISCGMGHNKIRYALIDLVPFCFHYDLSQVFQFRCNLLQYVIAFNDLHNFFVPVDVYKKFFREEWLMTKLSLKELNPDTPYYDAPLPVKVMDQQAIDADTVTFEGKYYPETRDENIKILDDYLTLCEENNIRPVMFIVTESEKHMANFNPQLLEEFYVLIEQACQKHPSAVFFDGWKLKDFTYADFFDHGHMNRHGAAKFSAYLNNFIEELDSHNYFGA